MMKDEFAQGTAASTENFAETPKPGFLAVFSWALYDLSNTIYSAAVISIYFPAFIKDDLQQNDIWYALPSAIAALLVGLASPLMGRLSDRGGNRMKWLVSSTLLSVVALLLMGILPVLGIAVAAFVVANSAYQAALMFYDSLLPSVSTPKDWGKTSGYGVGLGYFGGLAGFLLVPVITEAIFGKHLNTFTGVTDIRNSDTFLVAAVMFGVLSLPCFLFVREKRYSVKVDSTPITFGNSITQTWRTLKEASKYPGLMIFLVSNFFYSDALNTVIVAMGIYSTKVIGFSSAERNNFLAFSTVFAVIGSVIFGFLTDRLGPKLALNISLVIWFGVFGFAIVAPPKDLFFWIGGPLAGIALGSVWVAARTLMIELTPPERLGEFLGIYNLTGKFAAVLGPAIWGLSLYIFDPEGPWGNTGYQIAIGGLFILIAIGFVLHQWVPVVNRKARGNEYNQAEAQPAV